MASSADYDAEEARMLRELHEADQQRKLAEWLKAEEIREAAERQRRDG
jgi:hypothetical protein